MIWFQIFWEFFKAGLFAAGGGLATLPFLYAISESTGWFSTADIANMIAISESTPGPLGDLRRLSDPRYCRRHLGNAVSYLTGALRYYSSFKSTG